MSDAGGGIGFVEAVVIDVSDLERGMAFWLAVLRVRFGASVEPTFRRANLPSGLAVVLQLSEEAKTGRNRVHVDIEVRDLEEGLRRVEAAGGSLVSRFEKEVGSHVVCADVDGNEFCLTLA